MGVRRAAGARGGVAWAVAGAALHATGRGNRMGGAATASIGAGASAHHHRARSLHFVSRRSDPPWTVASSSATSHGHREERGSTSVVGWIRRGCFAADGHPLNDASSERSKSGTSARSAVMMGRGLATAAKVRARRTHHHFQSGDEGGRRRDVASFGSRRFCFLQSLGHASPRRHARVFARLAPNPPPQLRRSEATRRTLRERLLTATRPDRGPTGSGVGR